MIERSDAAIISALRREMNRAVARQVATAGNLANLETPGFKTQEPVFSDTLDGMVGAQLRLASTSGAHLEGQPVSGSATTKTVDGLPARLDGNTVQLARELMNMAQAGGDFAKAQTALAAKFRLVRYAISEGR